MRHRSGVKLLGLADKGRQWPQVRSYLSDQRVLMMAALPEDLDPYHHAFFHGFHVPFPCVTPWTIWRDADRKKVSLESQGRFGDPMATGMARIDAAAKWELAMKWLSGRE